MPTKRFLLSALAGLGLALASAVPALAQPATGSRSSSRSATT